MTLNLQNLMRFSLTLFRSVSLPRRQQKVTLAVPTSQSPLTSAWSRVHVQNKSRCQRRKPDRGLMTLDQVSLVPVSIAGRGPVATTMRSQRKNSRSMCAVFCSQTLQTVQQRVPLDRASVTRCSAAWSRGRKSAWRVCVLVESTVLRHPVSW